MGEGNWYWIKLNGGFIGATKGMSEKCIGGVIPILILKKNEFNVKMTSGH